MLDNSYKERVEQLNIQIGNVDEQPEDHLIEAMLVLYKKQKDFDKENFSDKLAIKKYTKDNANITDFLMKNQVKVTSTRK